MARRNPLSFFRSISTLLCLAMPVFPYTPFTPLSLKSEITNVQPMTGIVYWAGIENKDAPIQLEFSYIYYNEIATEEDPQKWKWSRVEDVLNQIKSNGHQAVIRFADISGNKKETDVPEYIKKLKEPTKYTETEKTVDCKELMLPDWSHKELKKFYLTFYREFAQRYDTDSRIAFIETGFGIWSEYHITPNIPILGKDFPDKEFQKAFVELLGQSFSETYWLISLDAHSDWAPFRSQSELLNTKFGVFDDSFLDKHYIERKKERSLELIWQ